MIKLQPIGKNTYIVLEDEIEEKEKTNKELDKFVKELMKVRKLMEN